MGVGLGAGDCSRKRGPSCAKARGKNTCKLSVWLVRQSRAGRLANRGKAVLHRGAPTISLLTFLKGFLITQEYTDTLRIDEHDLTV